MTFRLLHAASISTHAHQDAAKASTVADNIAIAVAQALVVCFIYVVVIAAVV